MMIGHLRLFHSDSIGLIILFSMYGHILDRAMDHSGYHRKLKGLISLILNVCLRKIAMSVISCVGWASLSFLVYVRITYETRATDERVQLEQ